MRPETPPSAPAHPPLIAIFGPTASGKSALALAISETLDNGLPRGASPQFSWVANARRYARQSISFDREPLIAVG